MDWQNRNERMEKEERLRRQREFLIEFAFWAVVIGIVGLVLKAAGSVLLPFVLAFAAAWLLSVPVDRAAERLHIRRGIVSVAVVLLFYGGLVCLICFACSRLAGLFYDTFENLMDFFAGTIVPALNQFFRWIEHTFGLFSPQAVQGGAAGTADAVEKVEKLFSGISDGMIAGVSGIAAKIPGIFMNVVITVIATIFMELEFHSMKVYLKRWIPEKYRKNLREGKAHVGKMLKKCVLSYALIFLMTFAELLIGFLLLRIDGAVVIAFLTAVLDILPVFGTGTVLLPWAVTALVSGNVKIGIGISVLYLVITVVRNMAEPKLVGRQMGISPVIMLPCMLIGLKLFGVIGLFLLPLAAALFKSVSNRRMQEREAR